MDKEKVKGKLRQYMYEVKEEAEIEGYTDTWKEWVFGAIDFCKNAGLIDDDDWKQILEEYDREIRGIEDE